MVQLAEMDLKLERDASVPLYRQLRDQIAELMADLRRVGVQILTIGQYLAPSGEHLPVARFVEPSEFIRLTRLGREMGFPAVAAGPFVRSSYHGEKVFAEWARAQEAAC